MERQTKWFSLSLAIAGTMLFTVAVSAQCSDGCNSCGSETSFGYPAESGYSSAVGCGSGCGSRCGLNRLGSGGGLFSSAKSHYHHLASINDKAFERSRAWPKPFDCADRQLYFSIWDQMLTHGYQLNCVFDNSHFDPETNQLNAAGTSKLKGIFLNSPKGQKVAYVQNSGSTQMVDSRLNNLRNTIEQWYGSENFSEIAATNIRPSTFAGPRVEVLQQLGTQSIAPPFIPVATGTGSTTSQGGQ